MAKKSLTAQFDEIQARLEAAGMTVQREGKHSVKATIVFHKSCNGYSDWTGAIGAEKYRDRPTSNVRVTINGVSKWESDESPSEAFSTLMGRPFGRTTIGAVFGV